jgi:hypothetical protein
MKFRRGLCLVILMLASYASPDVLLAAIVSQVSLAGELYDPPSGETVGGAGVASAQIGSAAAPRVASQVADFGVTRSLSGWTLASAESGRLAFGLSSSIVVPMAAPSARLSPFITSINNRVIDELSIGPGSGPGGALQNGDPAQVLVQIRLEGQVQQTGRPSGGMQFALEVRAGAGSANLPRVFDYNTGGLNPPQFIIIDERADILIDVTVGGVVGIDALMSGWINGTAFDPGLSGTNSIMIDPIVRVSNAPGYELAITSEAGAPTTPLPEPTRPSIEPVLQLLLLSDD